MLFTAQTSVQPAKYASSASRWNVLNCEARPVPRLRLATCIPFASAHRTPAAKTAARPRRLAPSTRTL